MDLTTIKVSIILPTYKREPKYLERAIESLLNQTHENIEIVIIDDNHENSEERVIINNFMKKYKENNIVKYYKNETNLGGALARNEGINLATGDYITFLDDDDIYLPDKIRVQLKFMLKNNYDLSFTNLKIVNENEKIVEFRKFKKLKLTDKNSLLKYHLMRHLTGTPTFMFKSTELKKIDGFEPAKVGQEFLLMFKAINASLKIGYLDDCHVVAYRHKLGGISQGKNKIEGEMELYKFKKTYFEMFTIKERMFIMFRHNAVMSVAYYRNKEYLNAIFYTFLTILSSPIDFIKEISKRATNYDN